MITAFRDNLIDTCPDQPVSSHPVGAHYDQAFPTCPCFANPAEGTTCYRVSAGQLDFPIRERL